MRKLRIWQVENARMAYRIIKAVNLRECEQDFGLLNFPLEAKIPRDWFLVVGSISRVMRAGCGDGAVPLRHNRWLSEPDTANMMLCGHLPLGGAQEVQQNSTLTETESWKRWNYASWQEIWERAARQKGELESDLDLHAWGTFFSKDGSSKRPVCLGSARGYATLPRYEAK